MFSPDVCHLRDEMVRLRDMLTQKDTQLEKFVDMLVKRRINLFVINWDTIISKNACASGADLTGMSAASRSR